MFDHFRRETMENLSKKRTGSWSYCQRAADERHGKATIEVEKLGEYS
jgi:hypothetical protein